MAPEFIMRIEDYKTQKARCNIMKTEYRASKKKHTLLYVDPDTSWVESNERIFGKR